MAKIKMKTEEILASSFEKFLLSKRAKGITEKAIQTYSQHFHAVGKHLDINQETEKLSSEVMDFLTKKVKCSIIEIIL